MLKKFLRNNLKTILVSVVLLLPVVISASQFGADSNLEISNTSLTFETQVNNTQTKSIIIENTSDQTKKIQVSHYPSNYFNYNGSTYINVPSNGSTSINIQFNPQKTGDFNSELILKSIDTGVTKTISLQGKATSTSSIKNQLEISTKTLNFGSQNKGSKTEQSFTIKNTYDKSINFSINSIESPFRIKSYPSNIEANSTGTFTVEFTPSDTKDYQKNLIINSSDPKTQTITITLIGKGNTSSSTSTTDSNNNDTTGKKLTLNSSQVNFGTKNLDSSSSKTINIYNPNSFPVTIKIKENFSKPFNTKLNSQNKLVIAAKTTKTIKVSFNPTKKGSFQSTATFQTDLDNQKTFSLKATGSTYGYTSPSSTTNQTTTTPSTTKTPTKETQLTLTKNKINQASNETTYFNLYLGKEFDPSNNLVNVYIYNTTDGSLVYSTNKTVNYGENYYTLGWSGKDSKGGLLPKGTYRFQVVASSKSITKKFNGYINLTNYTTTTPTQTTKTPQPTTSTKPVVKQSIYTPAPAQIYNTSKPTTPSKNPNPNACNSFTDIDNKSNLCSSINFLTSQAVFRKSEKFNPNQEVTRAQALSSIMQLFDIELSEYDKSKDGNLGYTDLKTNEWYMPFIKTAQELNQETPILNSSKQFNPDQTVTRGELYKMFFEIANNSKNNQAQFQIDYFPTQKPFQDIQIDKNMNWYAPYAHLAQQEFHGTTFAKKYFQDMELKKGEANFKANSKITKEELAEFLYETKKLKLIKFQ